MRSHPLWAYLQLIRPANILTAWADILVGYAATGSISVVLKESLSSGLTISLAGDLWSSLGWLILSTSGLYGGGIVFNDVFDAELDQAERPERPIPSGRVPLQSATVFGTLLLMLGILAAAQVSLVSAGFAAAVAIAALTYDSFGKHQGFLGPLNMGLCRGGNLLLGVSAVPGLLTERWFLAFIPVTYIAAVTAVSQGEVNGGKRETGVLAVALVILVLSGLMGLGRLEAYDWRMVIPFAGLFSALVLPAFVGAASDPSPETIQRAVRSGILSLIVLDAAIAAGFAGWLYGLITLSLLPMSRKLARLFSMT